MVNNGGAAVPSTPLKAMEGDAPSECNDGVD